MGILNKLLEAAEVATHVIPTEHSGSEEKLSPGKVFSVSEKSSLGCGYLRNSSALAQSA
jgi:hypothetical protein